MEQFNFLLHLITSQQLASLCLLHHQVTLGPHTGKLSLGPAYTPFRMLGSYAFQAAPHLLSRISHNNPVS